MIFAIGSCAFADDSDLSGKLSIWVDTSERGIAAEAFCDVLSEKYPNIEFSYEAKPDNVVSTALTTAFQSGNGPDVYMTCGTKNATFAGQVTAGNALDLTGK